MNKTTHTPGPWTVAYRPSMSIEGSIHAVIDKDRYPAAFVPAWDCPPNPSPDEAKANATLIAAAPDYHRQTELTIGGLEMLRLAIEADDPKPELLRRVKDLLRENKAMQAKAEGR
jgi:hypothetical protein